MRIPSKVESWLSENGFGKVKHSSSVRGGCINNGMVIHTSNKNTFFLKTNTQAQPDMFDCETRGLTELNKEAAPRVPEVYLWDVDFILMENVGPGTKTADYWTEFGVQLAGLHNYQSDRFGFDHDNYIGSTPQRNDWTGDGYKFFGELRLLFQARMARDRGYIHNGTLQKLESLVEKLEDLIPVQPASLLHGDLWSGNAIVDENGHPAIIDPAVHYGWAEAELAMTTLFGSFPAAFYEEYTQTRKLENGYRERFPIYNLYHLLNHVNLFGSSYLPQVISILDRFS